MAIPDFMTARLTVRTCVATSPPRIGTMPKTIQPPYSGGKLDPAKHHVIIVPARSGPAALTIEFPVNIKAFILPRWWDSTVLLIATAMLTKNKLCMSFVIPIQSIPTSNTSYPNLEDWGIDVSTKFRVMGKRAMGIVPIKDPSNRDLYNPKWCVSVAKLIYCKAANKRPAPDKILPILASVKYKADKQKSGKASSM